MTSIVRKSQEDSVAWSKYLEYCVQVLIEPDTSVTHTTLLRDLQLFYLQIKIRSFYFYLASSDYLILKQAEVNWEDVY